MAAPADRKQRTARPSASPAEQSAPAAASSPARARSYALAIFLGSTLLFLLEPIAAKRLVPLLGGSAAVWTACLVFFQTALLFGYYLAHLLVTRTTLRTQVRAYVGLLGLSVVQLALVVDPALRANVERPIASVLWLLCTLIGLPFVTLSATSPLLQAWFARTTPGGRDDAYRLFAISNFGSIVALLAYPWLLEPRLSLRAQTILVTIVLGMLAILAGVIGASVRNSEEVQAPAATESAPVRPATRVLWVALAACASLLLAATTTHISQNVVALPLVWILPLVAYLLSFVVAFSTRAWLPRWLVVVLAIVGQLLSAELLDRGVLGVRIIPATAAFCVALFFLCLFLHRELYLRRPEPSRLTSFYFHVAAGGALGAVLVGIVAPLVSPGNYDVSIGLLLTAVLGLVVAWPGRRVMRVVWGLLILDGIVLVASQIDDDRGSAILRVRNFYGTLRVTHVHQPPKPDVRSLYHGVIVHGLQVYRLELRRVPNTYYARTSGLGLALDQCCHGRPRRIGVIGLGTGAVAVYGNPGDTIRFYEINSAVEDIARSYFTYIGDSPASIDVVTGDARVSLEGEPPQRYDVLVVDAFSGDAIPAHLLTIQALEVYRRHLAPGGIIAFNVSNDFLALAPVLDQLARKAGMQAVDVIAHEDATRQQFDSEWVLVTSNAEFLANPAIVGARQPIAVPSGLRLWTDDYSSLVPIIKLQQRRF
jgi:hypothetical protein